MARVQSAVVIRYSGSVWLLGALLGAGCQGSAPPRSMTSPPCGGAGSICTWAGTGDPAFIEDGAAARETALYYPLDVEFAPGPGGLGYILDWQNHRVRMVGADGLVKTVIGTDEIGDGPGAGSGLDELDAPGVPGTKVNLNHPTDIQFTPDGETMFLAAWHNHKIRKYDVASQLLQVTCGRGPGFAGDGGPASTALMNQPKGIVLDGAGDLLVVDTRNFRVRRIAAETGQIDTVAGIGMRGSAGDGAAPLEAQFSFQQGLDVNGGDGGDNPEPGGAIAMDGQGRLYIADTENHRIRVVDLKTGIIDTVVGNGTAGYGGDGGPARDAALHRPWGIAFDGAGDLFVADTFNNRIRRVVQP